jgi:hypothetical protein
LEELICPINNHIEKLPINLKKLFIVGVDKFRSYVIRFDTFTIMDSTLSEHFIDKNLIVKLESQITSLEMIGYTFEFFKYDNIIDSCTKIMIPKGMKKLIFTSDLVISFE